MALSPAVAQIMWIYKSVQIVKK